MGRKDRFPTPTLDAINKIMVSTQNNSGMILNIAFDYGGRCDIVEATKIVATNVVNKTISIDEITEDYFKEFLFVKSNVDLLVRTSGELRVSNFLLWQMAYAEFYFTKCLWPDFNEKDALAE